MSEYILTPAEHAILELGRDPYDWQIGALESIGLQEFGGPPTSLVAANGSGKTSDVVAAAVSWFLRKYPLGWCIITSGSWNQLKNQLWPGLSALKQHNPGWRVRRGSECTISTPESREKQIGGAIGFSTKDAHRAEGWHPKPGFKNPVFIIVDEAKGVPDEIFEAFDRCTALFRLLTSSPGGPAGRFYDSHHELRSMFDCIKVPSALCPHISAEKIARDLKLYRSAEHPIFRSMHLAEFTEGSDLLIISPTLVAEQLEATTEWALKIPGYNPKDITAFGDFAAGRDENVLAVCDGKRVWIVDAWQEANTVQGARQFVDKLRVNKVPDSNAWGDADGLGIGFCDQIREADYSINDFRGGLEAEDDDHYCSAISEAWFESGRMIAYGDIILCGELARSPETIRQLTTRLSQWDDKGRLRAERKPDMAKRGLKSPDRADAILCAIYKHFHAGGAITERNMAGLHTATTSTQRFAQAVRFS